MTSSEAVARDREGQTGVIGATGFVGGAVLRALRSAGANPVSLLPRPLVEYTAASATAEPRRCEETLVPIFRHFDFHDERTFEPAMSGIKRLFLMRPPAIGDVERVVFPLLEAAVKSGVERIVFLSVVALRRAPTFLTPRSRHTLTNSHAALDSRSAFCSQVFSRKIYCLRIGRTSNMMIGSKYARARAKLPLSTRKTLARLVHAR